MHHALLGVWGRRPLPAPSRRHKSASFLAPWLSRPRRARRHIQSRSDRRRMPASAAEPRTVSSYSLLTRSEPEDPSRPAFARLRRPSSRPRLRQRPQTQRSNPYPRDTYPPVDRCCHYSKRLHGLNRKGMVSPRDRAHNPALRRCPAAEPSMPPPRRFEPRTSCSPKATKCSKGSLSSGLCRSVHALSQPILGACRAARGRAPKSGDQRVVAPIGARRARS